MADIRTELETIKKHIPVNTYKIIIGQIKAGHEDAARVGIERIKKKAGVGRCPEMKQRRLVKRLV